MNYKRDTLKSAVELNAGEDVISVVLWSEVFGEGRRGLKGVARITLPIMRRRMVREPKMDPRA